MVKITDDKILETLMPYLRKVREDPEPLNVELEHELPSFTS